MSLASLSMIMSELGPLLWNPGIQDAGGGLLMTTYMALNSHIKGQGECHVIIGQKFQGMLSAWLEIITFPVPIVLACHIFILLRNIKCYWR